MVTRFLVALVAVAALAIFSGVSLAEKDDAGDTHSGVVVSAGEGKLTMTDKDGKEHSHDITADAKISCNGEACKLEDLKKGTSIKVTVKDKKVTKIEGKTKKAK